MMTLGAYIAWMMIMRNWAIITYIGLLNMRMGFKVWGVS